MNRARALGRRFGPLALIALALVWAVASGAVDHLSLAELKARHHELGLAVAAHPAACLGAYLALYVAVVGLSLPGAMLMTLTGGFLFGPLVGGVAALTGATTGSSVTFLVCRAAAGDASARPTDTSLARIEAGIRANAFSYILTLRLIPLVPLMPVNIAAGLVRVPLRTFVLASFLGMAPCTFLSASVGAGLGAMFARGEDPDLRMIFAPRILLPLMALATMVFASVIWRNAQGRRAAL